MYFNLYFLVILTFSDIVFGKSAEEQIQRKLIAQSNDDAHFTKVLNNIMKPRIVGTPNHDLVKQFIISELKALEMHTETDEFNDIAPHFGNLTFTNIIGRTKLNADNYLTLACHYDSKYFREHNFDAAVDSAVPCTIMLNTVKTLLPSFKTMKNSNNMGLMLIFFDGEEAFREWGPNDSLYGSRHLAKMWTNKNYIKSDCGTISEIQRIDLMILLDLIGAPDQKFYNFFDETSTLYMQFYEIEKSLKTLRLLDGSHSMFTNKPSYSRIEDDHLPFLTRGTPIIHLIPSPFPTVWHTADDIGENLSKRTITNFNKIIRIYVYEYLMNQQFTGVDLRPCPKKL